MMQIELDTSPYDGRHAGVGTRDAAIAGLLLRLRLLVKTVAVMALAYLDLEEFRVGRVAGPVASSSWSSSSSPHLDAAGLARV